MTKYKFRALAFLLVTSGFYYGRYYQEIKKAEQSNAIDGYGTKKMEYTPLDKRLWVFIYDLFTFSSMNITLKQTDDELKKDDHISK